MTSHLRRISHLILDFDETLTTTDTVSLLASAAYRLTTPNIPPWCYFVDQYLADYTRHALSHPKASRRTPAQELAFLSSLLPIERASIQRIETASVFRGLPITAVAQAAAATVPLRPGIWNVCAPVLAGGGHVNVLSVNWSRAWIRSSLSSGVAQEGGDREWFEREVGVFCNELVHDSSGITTGALSREPTLGADEGIWTAAHKGVMMERLVGERDGAVVYVGDSSTDLVCLLQADVGVVIGDKLDEVCARIGVALVEGLEGVDAYCGGQLRLYKAQDLETLGRWVRSVFDSRQYYSSDVL